MDENSIPDLSKGTPANENSSIPSHPPKETPSDENNSEPVQHPMQSLPSEETVEPSNMSTAKSWANQADEEDSLNSFRVIQAASKDQ